MSRIKYLLMMMSFAGLAPLLVFSQATKSYDEEISRIVGKIQQYPDRTKDLGQLKENFDLANKIDHDHIVTLLQSGQPDIWLEVYKGYMRLENRQLVILKIPEKSIQLSGIQMVDYQYELKDSRYKATAYHYALGEKLMKSDKQEDARLAYVEFIKVASLNSSFKDLDKLLRKAILKGATNVEFELHNRTGKNISPTLVNHLSVIIWDFKKAKYGQEKPVVTDDSFTFILRVILDDLLIGADQVKQLEYQEERDIYSGNQVIDTIKCLVNETRQLKKALLSGNLEYVDKQTGKVVNRIPIKVESVFSNAYASLQGNPDAAGEVTRELLKAKQAPYPSNEQMIIDATEEFSRKAGEVILSE
ncbi:MAG: hypothetical protein HGA23_02030 [Bacteroidales bacterium]|nr:hypothetical protein [Bacteroidales bacterium]